MIKKKVSERKKLAQKTDLAIINYLKQQERPVTFYTLCKNLDFSSGKAQTALKRLQEKNKVFLRRRIKRFENLVWYKDFNVESNIVNLERENEIIFPIHLNRTIAKILQEIPELTFEYKTITDLFKKAIIYFFQKQISYDLRSEAIKQAIKKGEISKAVGKQIMGV